ncbi:unnamed protein product [Pleuronectes platessa]|uniref:Uncharacterized protein n=1 Tax=Pleuronectes platessa TaxID=8262 RepID=A0A9N7U943_PLEPL|nr:unnamed protein product [Pleuronectes platessa]
MNSAVRATSRNLTFRLVISLVCVELRKRRRRKRRGGGGAALESRPAFARLFKMSQFTSAPPLTPSSTPAQFECAVSNSEEVLAAQRPFKPSAECGRDEQIKRMKGTEGKSACRRRRDSSDGERKTSSARVSASGGRAVEALKLIRDQRRMPPPKQLVTGRGPGSACLDGVTGAASQQDGQNPQRSMETERNRKPAPREQNGRVDGAGPARQMTTCTYTQTYTQGQVLQSRRSIIEISPWRIQVSGHTAHYVIKGS